MFYLSALLSHVLHDIAVCNIQQGTVCTLCMALCAQCGLCVETNRLCKHIRTEHSFDKSTRAGLQFSWKKMGLNAYFFCILPYQVLF